jgi:hypothetical protein
VQEAGAIPLYFTPEGIHGGTLLGVRGAEHISFYDWSTLRCVRRIDVTTEAVHWNAAGDMLALVTATGFYILQYDREAVAAALTGGAVLDEDGLESAFEVVTEVSAVLELDISFLVMGVHRACDRGSPPPMQRMQHAVMNTQLFDASIASLWLWHGCMPFFVNFYIFFCASATTCHMRENLVTLLLVWKLWWWLQSSGEQPAFRRLSSLQRTLTSQ